MTYNLNGSSSSTLTPAERSRETRRLLALLREEDQDELEHVLSSRATDFMQEMWDAVDLLPEGTDLSLTDSQLYFLRDIWNKFA